MNEKTELQREAIANADAYVNNVCLPAYSELLAAYECEQQREKEETERRKHGHDQAVCQAEGIAEMVAALDVDYDRLEELRDKRKAGHWVAGWNIPGFMPDNTPEAFDDEDDALEYIKEAAINEAEGEDDALEYIKEAAINEAEGEQLQADKDAIDEWSTDRNGEFGLTFGKFHYWITHKPGELSDPEEAEELRELEEKAGDCESRDDAEERIQEDPLSVEVRSDWHTPGEEGEPDEFMILLCTGGPAVRIVGELDQHRQPCRAWIEYQDWFTPWSELVDAPIESDTLLTYCQQFYFGE